MKRILLTVLAYGMFISTFAQKDTSNNNLENSEKWVITPVAGMKGLSGRLNMNFPAGVDWNIWIYNQADNKFINSFYPIHKKQSFNLSPGEYRIKLGNVTVENVSIQKGKETRIRAGVLNVADESSWELYDELKENIITTNTRPQKMVLPIGNYKITILGQDRDVEIRDEHLGVSGVQEIPTINMDPWTISPLRPLGTEPGKEKGGLLQVNFLADSIYDAQKYEFVPGKIKISRSGHPDVLLTSDKFSADGHPLPSGIYQVTLNNVLVANVPIEANKKTKLKTGTLKVNQSVLNYGDGDYDGSALWGLYRYGASITPGNLYPLPQSDAYCKTYRTGTITLPVGRYGFFVNGSYPVNEITMGNNKSANIDITLGLAKVTWSEDWEGNPVMWSIYSEDGSKRYASCCNPLHSGQKLQHVFLPIGRYMFKYKDQIEMFTLEASYLPDELFAH
jgi:hypothetical protein